MNVVHFKKFKNSPQSSHLSGSSCGWRGVSQHRIDWQENQIVFIYLFFYKIRFLVLARIPFKMWKISTCFSMSLCLSYLCSSFFQFFTGPAQICDVTKSNTWIWVRDQAAIVSWQRSRAVIFTFSFIYLLFRPFRWFRFVVSGFSTCHVDYIAWIITVLSHCFGDNNNNLTFVFDLNYFLWKLKTSKRQGLRECESLAWNKTQSKGS